VLKQRQPARRNSRQARRIIGEQNAQLAIAPRDRANIGLGRYAKQLEEI
jgi:hypothetical protein